MVLSLFRRCLAVALSLLSVTILCTGCGTQQDALYDWHTQYTLALDYVQTQQYQEATLSLLTAISLDPTQSATYLTLSDILIAQEDWPGAADILNQGIQASQDNQLDMALLTLKQAHPTLGAPTAQEILNALSGLWIHNAQEAPLLLAIAKTPAGLYYSGQGWFLSDDFATYDVASLLYLDDGRYCFTLTQESHSHVQYLQLDTATQHLWLGTSPEHLVSYERIDTNVSQGYQSLVQEHTNS